VTVEGVMPLAKIRLRSVEAGSCRRAWEIGSGGGLVEDVLISVGTKRRFLSLVAVVEYL